MQRSIQTTNAFSRLLKSAGKYFLGNELSYPDTYQMENVITLRQVDSSLPAGTAAPNEQSEINRIISDLETLLNRKTVQAN